MRIRPLALVAACLTLSPLARAADPSSSPVAPVEASVPPPRGPEFADRFFRGTSAGALPTEKALVIGTLYAGSLTSIGFGIASLLRASHHGADAEGFKLKQEPGFCTDLASGPCARYRTLLSDERASRGTGILLLGAGGLLALGGALTAELWQNDRRAPRLALSFDGAGAFFSAGKSF